MNTDAMLHASPGHCPNCHSATSGNYCQHCSQETVLHPPSAREFMHEFIGHYVALEGKLWQSLWLLLVRPGRLTLEYIQGRRVRYVQPLRLYLTFSLVFFAMIKLSGVAFMHTDYEPTVPAAPGKSILYARADSKSLTPIPNEDNQFFVESARLAERIHHGWGARVSNFLTLPKEEIGHQMSKAFFSYAPYAMFALMPVFALLLKLLYLGTGRRYGAHLLFALHANAFAFAVLALQIAIPSGWGWVHTILLLWMIFYLPLAMRRVYGSGWFLTGLRWIVLMLLHALCIAVAIGVTLASAVVA